MVLLPSSLYHKNNIYWKLHSCVACLSIIEIKGLFLNDDAEFDCKSFPALCANNAIHANIALNPINTIIQQHAVKQEGIDLSYYFDSSLFNNRIVFVQAMIKAK